MNSAIIDGLVSFRRCTDTGAEGADDLRSTGAEIFGGPDVLAGAGALPTGSPSMLISSPSMSSSWPNMDCTAALGALRPGGWRNGPPPPAPPPAPKPLDPVFPWLIVSPLTNCLVLPGSSKSLTHCAYSAAVCSSSFLRFASSASLCF